MKNKDEFFSYERAHEVFRCAAAKYGITVMEWGFGRWLWLDNSGTELEYWERMNAAGILTADGRKRLRKAEEQARTVN